MGAAVMFIGMDDEAGPQLYKCDPAGHFVGYKVSVKIKKKKKNSSTTISRTLRSTLKTLNSHIDSATKHMRITLFRAITMFTFILNVRNIPHETVTPTKHCYGFE
jgi:hypothetical protein